MGEPDNVRAFVAPAYAEEVRSYLLPFSESYGKTVERAVNYVLTGRNREVVGELMATIVRYDDAAFHEQVPSVAACDVMVAGRGTLSY